MMKPMANEMMIESLGLVLREREASPEAGMVL